MKPYLPPCPRKGATGLNPSGGIAGAAQRTASTFCTRAANHRRSHYESSCCIVYYLYAVDLYTTLYSIHTQLSSLQL